MSDKPVTVRTRKFLANPLLARKQFVVDVIHRGRAALTREEIKDQLARLYDVSDKRVIILYGFQTKYGGGKTSGFGLIYDTFDAMQRYEPKHRLQRAGYVERVDKSAKSRKERKNRAKKFRGKERVKILYKK